MLRRRRMVRRFDPERPVPPDVLDEILYAALRAPSAGFSQGWDFVVLEEQADREAFWQASAGGAAGDGGSVDGPTAEPDPWLRGVKAAPVLVLCLSHPDAYLDRYAEPDKGWTDRDPARWPIPYWDVDTGMAAMLMLLTAVDEGLGALFFGVPADRHDAVREAHGIPADRRVVGVVALGHEATRTTSPSLRRGRRPASQVVHWGAFGAQPGESVPGTV